MAKNIKALKCPHCGSVKKQAIKEDHYLCNNCGTEYYLDNDDININIKHNYNRPNTWQWNDSNKKNLVILFVFVAAIILVPLFVNLFNNTNQTVINPVIPETPKEKEKGYRDYVSDFIFNSNQAKDNVIILMRMQRRFDNRDLQKVQSFIRFYDWNTGKVLSDIQMKNWSEGNYLRFRTFDNGKTYIIPDKINRVYEANFDKQTITDVTEELFNNVPEFSSGIATMEFFYVNEGDGFKIMTNDGKEFFYFPGPDLIFKDYSAVRKINKGKNTLKPNAVEVPKYIFSIKSSDYPDEKIQLLKYWYRYNLGYPYERPYRLQWKKEYQYPKGSGIFIGTFPYKKKLFTDTRIRKFIDLTPDRLYFDPKIEYQDSTNLIISGFPNANPESNRIIQKIDTNDGKVLWSFNAHPEGKYRLDDELIPFKGGIIMHLFLTNSSSNNRIVQLDQTGKIVKEVDVIKVIENNTP